MTTNNEVSTFVTVRAGGINVLYLVGAKRIGGGPGPGAAVRAGGTGAVAGYRRRAAARSITATRLRRMPICGRWRCDRDDGTAGRTSSFSMMSMSRIEPGHLAGDGRARAARHGPDDGRRLSQLRAGRISRFAAGRRAADQHRTGAAAEVSANRCATTCICRARCGCGRRRRWGTRIRSCRFQVVQTRQPPALPGVIGATLRASGNNCRRWMVRIVSSAAN